MATFEEKQIATYAFLKAFYNRAELGYSVDNYTEEDVTQEIIDIVNQMGKDMIRNARILAVADVFKLIASGTSNIFDFVSALIQIIYTGSGATAITLLQTTEQTLLAEKDKIKKNRLAYSAFIQILNREKGNIELKFMGF